MAKSDLLFGVYNWQYLEDATSVEVPLKLVPIASLLTKLPGRDRIRGLPSSHTMCQCPLVAGCGCCSFFENIPAECWLCVRHCAGTWDAKQNHTRVCPHKAHSPVVKRSINLLLLSQCLLVLCTARRWWEMLGFLSSKFWVPATPRGWRAHSQLPPSPYALNKHSVRIHFVQEARGATKTDQIYISLPWEIYKSNPSSFQVVTKLLPLTSTSGYHACSLYKTEVSPARRPQHPSGQTVPLSVVTVYERANWANELPAPGDLNNRCQNWSHPWPTNQKASLKDCWVGIKNTKSELLTAKRHCVLQWYQQTSPSYICGDLRVVP